MKQQVFRVVFDREEDGRWIAEVPELPGVIVYGKSKQEALLRVQALAYGSGRWKRRASARRKTAPQ